MATTAKTSSGSAWRKWDLQVQPTKSEWCTQLSSKSAEIKNATREYLKRAIENDVAVVAITDHNCGAAIDAALSLIRDEKLEVAVLPGVEIDVIGGFQLLVILNPEYVTRIGKTSWHDAINHFLNNVCQVPSPVFNQDGCAESVGANLHEVIERVCSEDIGVPIFAHVQSEKGLFKKSTPANRRKFFDRSFDGKYCFALDHKSHSEIDTTLKTLEGWGFDGRNFALIRTSDSHHASEVGSVFSWIKADCTYEGLKQILFDPQSRVSVADAEPVAPTNVIIDIAFDVPRGAKLRIVQKDAKVKDEPFCFAGTNCTYKLSPFFNCFIGGRGSGKSTILNFLGKHSRDPTSSAGFWEKIKPSFDPADSKVFAFSGVEVFEFIGQSEVESLANNRAAFTSAIYERANLLSDGQLHNQESSLVQVLTTLRSFRDVVEKIERLTIEEQMKSKEKKTLEGSVKITRTSEYIALSEQITDKSNKLQRLESWRAVVDELRLSIGEITDQHVDAPNSNDLSGESATSKETHDIAKPYVEAFAQARRNIEAAAKILAESKFKGMVKRETELAQEIEKHEKRLSQLLENAGLSAENVIQAKSAPQRLVRIEEELGKIRKRMSDRISELSRYEAALSRTEESRSQYETAIREAIAPLEAILEDQAQDNNKKDIKNIGLRYFFDLESAWQAIAADLHTYFSQRYRDSERPDFLRSYMVENKAIFTEGHATIVAHLVKVKKPAGYVKFLREVFSSDFGYQVFQTIRDQHLNDVSTYRRIQVLYDGKDIDSASFGQKCTAVIVILLLFGNYPLIIDEPEAHLDSSLIANYLVPLIKRKKSNRQLIFSTHNANFVVNGDAEKVFILTNVTGTTEIAEATIEDLSHREELLRLEGGREAFRKRGDKLRI